MKAGRELNEIGNLRCPREIRIHSMNPVGRQRMNIVAERLRDRRDPE